MKKIYVGNLPYQTNEQELQTMFEQFGEIDAVDLISDRHTGRSKGFAFITFTSQEAAQKALTLDGTEVGGRRMKVNTAQEKEERRSGGGGGGGGAGAGRRRW